MNEALIKKEYFREISVCLKCEPINSLKELFALTQVVGEDPEYVYFWKKAPLTRRISNYTKRRAFLPIIRDFKELVKTVRFQPSDIEALQMAGV